MAMKTILLLCAMLMSAIPFGAPGAAGCSAKSGAQTLAVVELYTSEGCNSCPPADRWLTGLKGTGAYPGRVLPLALHVDYWDYIGWKDPFAQAQFSARQREMAAISRTRTVYTPQVLVGGRDFRPGNGFDAAIEKINRAPPRANLEVKMSSGSARELKLDASAKLRNGAEKKDAVAYLAVFENGLASPVAAGENKGKLLKHDFVVREWVGPFAFATDGTLAVTRTVAVKAGWKMQDLGVAVFVQNRGSGEILQALQLASCI
jgi:hypothetical protein